MCGICGIYGRSDSELIKSMTKILEHRGPDDFGVYVDDNCCLGHRRLSILDLSKKGRQPMSNQDDDLVITYNGEIYNFKEIRTKLESKGYSFNSDTDTEVIIGAYKEYGEECLKLFNGMFAFCIYDKKNNSMFLARDRLGIKPLFYYRKDNKFVFASELKSILLDKTIERKINMRALEHQFAFEFIPAPLTIFEDIFNLPAGHFMHVSKDKIEIKQYWDMSFNVTNNSLGYYTDVYKNLLTESIERRLISDVPVGAFLSGGIDSASIIAIMTKLKENVKTFSIGFDLEGFDETKYARAIAEKFNTDHKEMIINADDVFKLTETLPIHMDEPFANPSIFNTYYVSEFARKEVTVVLTGDGGDELFAGYPWYIADSYYKYVPFKGLLKKTFSKVKQTDKYSGFTNKIKKLVNCAPNKKLRHLRWLTNFSDEEANKLFKDRIVKDGHEPAFKYLDSDNNRLNKMLYTDMKMVLADDYLKKVDRTTMKVSLEARVPFLDHKLVEFSGILPSKYKLNGLTTKYIMKRAMKGILPDEVLKKEKQGFTLPMKHWLRNDLNYLFEKHLSKSKLDRIGIFNSDYVQKLIDQHMSKSRDNQRMLWNLIVFDMFYEKNLSQ